MPFCFCRGVSAIRGITQVLAEAAAERIAAALRDDVDDAAGEAAIRRRDAMSQHARLENRVLDEQVVGGAEQVVVHVDAVHHEDVVEAEGASDDQLSRREGIARDARREFGNVNRPSSDRKGVDVALAVRLLVVTDPTRDGACPATVTVSVTGDTDIVVSSCVTPPTVTTTSVRVEGWRRCDESIV